MIPILMALFAAGGTIYGMAEESLPFYTLLVPVMLAARFDPVVAASTVLLGGDRHARLHHQPVCHGDRRQRRRDPFTNGIALRVALLVIGWIICVAWVMRYARKAGSVSLSSRTNRKRTSPISSATKANSRWNLPRCAKSSW
jgi:uncharacterized ion transporter superfamily protein YfcC